MSLRRPFSYLAASTLALAALTACGAFNSTQDNADPAINTAAPSASASQPIVQQLATPIRPRPATRTNPATTNPGTRGSGTSDSGTGGSGMTPPTTPESTAPTTTAPTREATPAPNKQLPPNAYKGAGGPVPASAIKLEIHPQEYGGDVATLKTPSGNIGCEIFADHLGCGVESWLQEEKYGGDYVGPNWALYLTTEAPSEVGTKSDAPYWYYDYTGVLQYGTVGYAFDYACASEETGITCWNVKSGHGF